MNSYSSPLDDFEEDPAQPNTTENSDFQNGTTASTDGKLAASSATNTEIVEELELPPVKIHCSVLAEDAIKAAINDLKGKAS